MKRPSTIRRRDSLLAIPKRSRAPGHLVHLSLIVPDFHALDHAAAQHRMGVLTRLIRILTADELASHAFAGPVEAEKSVDGHADRRGLSPTRQRMPPTFIPFALAIRGSLAVR
jgi:hypothetical protein